jgi:4a-hydroxytetrahydrobiopterin dehydratase
MALLTDDEVRAQLGDLPGWELGGGAIRKEYVFKGFRAAIGFIDRLAEVAIAAENHYNRVVVSLTSHDAGGVTGADLALARAIEAVAEPAGD